MMAEEIEAKKNEVAEHVLSCALLADEVDELKKENAKLKELLSQHQSSPQLLAYNNTELKEYLEDYIDRESEEHPKPTKYNIEFGDEEREAIEDGLMAQIENVIEDEIREKAMEFKYNEKTGKYEYEW